MTENKKIESIKEELKAASHVELPSFIERYSNDERSSVKNLIKSAKKRIEDYEKEIARIEKMKIYEKQYSSMGLICGVDEVGRGPLAGPVVTGAVILPEDCDILYLNDSKQLSEKKREELYDIIMQKAVAVSIGYNSPERIDEINILNATLEAMRISIEKMDPRPAVLLNDAVKIPGIDIMQVPIIKGDAKSISIAAASIVAKVTRDRLMVEYASKYPEYHFESNKGYGSKEHIEALKKYGPCEIHRRSFIGNFV